MKIRNLVLASALFAIATSASAWGPFGNGYNGGNSNNDFFGDGVADGAFNFNMNSSARSSARGNGYGHNSYAPSYGYAPYGYAPYGAAAPTAEQQKAAFEAQQKAHEERVAMTEKRRAEFMAKR